MDVFERYSSYVKRHRLLQQGEPVVVGVSGGADSLCVLDLLTRGGVKPIVAHLDHQLREDSASDAEFVRQVALRYGHPFELGTADLTNTDTGSLEERSRLARYRFLVDVAHKFCAQKIVVGHTFDDQVETILMHFIRGAGPAGLRGMLPATKLDEWVGIPRSKGMIIIRPMLEIRHVEALRYCEEIGIQPRFDRSNLDQTFFRNRIRHELLPILEEFNPGIRGVVQTLGEVMRSEVDFIEAQVESYWPLAVEVLSENSLILRWELFHKLPLALQRGLVRGAIFELKPTLRDLGFEHIERALEFVLDLDRPPSQTLIDSLVMHAYAEDVLLTAADQLPALPDQPQVIESIPLEEPLPEKIKLANGWVIVVTESVDRGLEEIRDRGHDAWDVVLDRSMLQQPLCFRTRRPGDRMQPLGMHGSAKVSDLMINRKIPRLAREHWPLLVAGDEIAWLPGVHIGHSFRVTVNTQDSLRLTIVRP